MHPANSSNLDQIYLWHQSVLVIVLQFLKVRFLVASHTKLLFESPAYYQFYPGAPKVYNRYLEKQTEYANVLNKADNLRKQKCQKCEATNMFFPTQSIRH